MTEQQHLQWDHAQEAVKHAVAAVQAFYASVPDTMTAHVVKNRVAMALDSLETAADQLAAARVRFAEQQKQD